MALDEQLTDDQQAEVVRNWLRENGGYIFGGIIAAFGGLFGWQQWQDYQRAQAERASALYEELLMAVRGGRATQADELFADMSSRFGGSAYVDQSRFVLAKAALDRNDFELAAEHLAAIVADTELDGILHIAQLRLARVRLQQRELDAALAALGTADPNSAFLSQYEEVRGDIYYEQERFEEARAAYEAALSAPQDGGVIDRVYVQAKLDALGGARAGAELAE
jgi:predicted negative regulator of RcsB-dependent stress response